MLAVLSALAFIITFVGIKGFIAWSGRREILDIPNERSSHSSPVPVGAGLVIAVVVIAAVLISAMPAISAGKTSGWSMTVYAVSSVALVAISWLDDVRPVSVVIRFSVHALAAGGILYAFQGWAGFQGFEALAGIAAFVWFVGLTNAYNFMDGIDGIAGIQAVTAGLGWLAIGVFAGSGIVSVFGAVLVTSAIAFLVFNWETAKVFMGDSGSAFIGFSLAAAPLVLEQDSPLSISPGIAVASVALVWPFVFDSSLTFAKRLLRGEKVWTPHRSHLYQAMVINGYRHSTVSLIYGAAGLLCTASAIGTVVFRLGLLPPAFAMGATAIGLIGIAAASSRKAGS